MKLQKKTKQKTFCGYGTDELQTALTVLTGMKDDIALSEAEDKAMDIAMAFIANIKASMAEGRKIRFDN